MAHKRIANAVLFFLFVGLLPAVISSVLFVCTGFADSKQRSRWVSSRRISSPRWPTSRESHSRFSIFYLACPLRLPPSFHTFAPVCRLPLSACVSGVTIDSVVGNRKLFSKTMYCAFFINCRPKCRQLFFGTGTDISELCKLYRIAFSLSAIIDRNLKN